MVVKFAQEFMDIIDATGQAKVAREAIKSSHMLCKIYLNVSIESHS